MNDTQLDDLIAKHRDGYNRSGDPPIETMLASMHARMDRDRSNRGSLTLLLGLAAVAILSIGLLSDLPSHRGRQPRLSPADAALVSAIESAEAAVKAHPGDSYFVEHLAAMKENAAEFEKLAATLPGST